ncbi:CBF/Mak21 family-domain-containing protein, partial [Ochromonadaceae sp. CCMP2298]
MKSDLKWMNDMIKSGTMSDKVASMALKIQGSPFHELDTLDMLLGFACKKEQRAAQLAVEALKDLFTSNLLPDRLLRGLDSNMLNHPQMDITTALLVWFEAQLKLRYEKLLGALEEGLKATVDHFKRECLQTAADLLIGKPEKEAYILSMIVNKLGDPSRASCSKAIDVLKLVMRAHPAMKMVVVREVRQFLYRPNLKIRPTFNGLILLSNVPLGPGDHAAAVQLVEGYLSLFEKTMKEEEYGSRLLAALLTGINKALPFLRSTESLEKYVDPLFKIVHTATSFTTATQALMLLSHLALSLVKRFYRALYAKLLSDQITTRSRNTLFLNLLYRSIKRDAQQNRAMAFIKRLLICATQSVPPIAAGLLFLVSEIMKDRPALKSCLDETPRTNKDKDKESSSTSKDNVETGFLGNFNVLKREPEHFHPSVQSFADSLLAKGHSINFAGDPTVEFSLMAFLNRF